MSPILISSIIYFLAGLSQEVLITSYHRCVYTERNFLASCLAALITIVSLLVFAEILKKIFSPLPTLLTYFYVVIFAAGKGFGAYGSLSWWSRNDHIHNANCDEKGDCQRRN